MMIITKYGAFDKLRLHKLKEALAKAEKNKKESFIFEDRSLLTKFAKYLVEYIESQLTQEEK